MVAAGRCDGCIGLLSRENTKLMVHNCRWGGHCIHGVRRAHLDGFSVACASAANAFVRWSSVCTLCVAHTGLRHSWDTLES